MVPANTRKKLPLHTRILLGLLAGALTGGVAQAALGTKHPSLAWFNDQIAKPGGNIFLYLIFMVVIPLLFSALVIGVGELGDATKVGKVGVLSLVMTVLLSGIAVGIALGAANLIRPGERIPEAKRQELIAAYSDQKAGSKNVEAAKKEADDPPVLGFIPKNPFKEINRALEGGLLPFMFFALVFGIALSAIEPEKALPIRLFFEGIFAVCQKIIDYAMALAPYGVFLLVFRTTSSLGWELFTALGLFVATVLGALVLHQFVTYSLVLRLIAKRNPWEFFRQSRTVMLTAFGTSSSNATLPTALEAAEKDLGLPRDISSFVLTVGATANQNGTALFEGITILFFAQLFGVDLSTTQQLTVLGLSIVAGVGTAGIPGGAWPMIATVLVMFKIPAEAIGIVLGIDRILDMSRTVLNVTGDLTIASCVATLSGRSVVVPEQVES